MSERMKPLPEGHVIEDFGFEVGEPEPRRAAEQTAQDWQDTQAFVRQSAMFPNNLNYRCQIEDIGSMAVIQNEDPNTTTVDRKGAKTHLPSDADQCVVVVWGRVSGRPEKVAEWKDALKRSATQEELPPTAREQLLQRRAARKAEEAASDAN